MSEPAISPGRAATSRISEAAADRGKIKTPVGDAPVIPLLLVMTGGYVMWFAIHYWKDTAVKWPSDPVKAILQGKGLPAHNPEDTTGPIDAAVSAAAVSGSAVTGPTPSGLQNLPIGDLGGNAQANQNIAKLLTAKYGWSPSQNDTEWNALVKLWNQESGWNNTAQNPGSTAYGIPQFLDTTWAPYGPKTSDAATQIEYGLAYIKDRYGAPSAAWAHEQGFGWY